MTATKDLIKNMLEVLKKEKVITVSDLANKIGSNWATTKHNVELLEICGVVWQKQIKSLSLVIYK